MNATAQDAAFLSSIRGRDESTGRVTDDLFHDVAALLEPRYPAARRSAAICRAPQVAKPKMNGMREKMRMSLGWRGTPDG